MPKGELAIPAGSPSRRFIEVAPVRRIEGSRELRAVGRVTFDEARVVNITSAISGRVVELRASVGAWVAAGAVLLAIDSPEIPVIRADLQKARIDLDAAARNLERTRALVREKAAAGKEELSSEVDLKKAAAEVERLRARLKLWHKDESDETQRFLVRAPRAGVIVKRNVNVGEEVRPDAATPLLSLADLSVVWVLAEIPERELALVKRGQPAQVEVTSYSGERFRGTVSHIGEVVNPETRAIQVRVALKNPGRRLKPEMYARVWLEVKGTKAQVVVPKTALVIRHDKTVVVVEVAAGKFVPREVVAGNEVGDGREVLSGLREGEKVVVRGALLLDAELQSLL
jgi:cobalt-zinc-cadmium efflux system membrane fusion protein